MDIKTVPGGKRKTNKKQRKAKKAYEPAASFKKRTPWLLIIFMALFAALAARVFYLTVIQKDFLQQKALSQWTRSTALSAARGNIVDCNGIELAVNSPVYKIVVWPDVVKKAEDRARIADELSKPLGVDRDNLMARLESEKIREYVVKRQVDKQTADSIRSLQLGRGVGIANDVKRFYPYGTLLSQVLGFTNIDSAGQSGLELSLDKYLTGMDGKMITQTDRNGNPLASSSYDYVQPVDGDKVRLTIDKYFQSYLENALEEAIAVNKAKDAQGIILDVTNGQIKAISTKPDFDPNSPPRSDLDLLSELSRNRVVTDAYEPGSTFKILTLAAALDSGSTGLESSFYCGGGYIVGGERIRCWRHAGHGSETLTQAVENSCNVCFMQLALNMGVEKFYDYLYAFGLGQVTGSGLPGESAGIVTHQKYIKDNDLARIGFGQSIAVTPIQLASAVAAAVNGGTLYTPYLIDEIIADDGTSVFRAEPTPVRRVISEDTSAKVRAILQSVVDNGTGRNARVEGYAIGGKTGTAQKYDSYGHISEGSYICSFIGFAPADRPRYVCLILVDEPHVGSVFGSTVAAPYVRRVFSEILPYVGIPRQDVNTQVVTLPDVFGMDMQTALRTLEAYGITGVYEVDAPVTLMVPAAGTSVPYGSSVLLYTGQEGLNIETSEPYYVTMPNLMDMTPLQAYDALRAVGLKMQSDPPDPWGVVIGQSVFAYEPVEYGSTVLVYFAAPTPRPTAVPETPAPTEPPATQTVPDSTPEATAGPAQPTPEPNETPSPAEPTPGSTGND